MGWVLLSFSLSLAFVLCNLGLMEGYDHIFRLGLRETQGDITVISREGFFKLTEDQEEKINKINGLKRVTFFIQTEVFLLSGDHSKAVQMRTWIYDDTLKLRQGEIILGEAIAKDWGVKVGDRVSLMFASGNSLGESLPEIKTFTVLGFRKHKIYLRDSRTVYTTHDDISLVTNAAGLHNIAAIELNNSVSTENINNTVENIQNVLGRGFSVRPFWYEFSGLLEAVKVEKNIITFALQLIVLVAMFNMTSFFRVLFETNYQALFLLRSLGLSLKSIRLFLLILSLSLWLISNIGAKVLSLVFAWLLKNWSFFHLPGKIYHLAQIELIISMQEVFLVASLSLIWVLLLWVWFARKLGQSDLVSVLKGEWR